MFQINIITFRVKYVKAESLATETKFAFGEDSDSAIIIAYYSFCKDYEMFKLMTIFRYIQVPISQVSPKNVLEKLQKQNRPGTEKLAVLLSGIIKFFHYRHVLFSQFYGIKLLLKAN